MRHRSGHLLVTLLLGLALTGCGFKLPNMLQSDPSTVTPDGPVPVTPTPSKHSAPPPSQQAPKPTPSGSGGSGASSRPAVPPPAEGTRVVSTTSAFTSPSGRISCLMDGKMVRCDYLAEPEWSAEPGGDCPAKSSRTLIVEDQARVGCAGDTVAGMAKPGSPETGWFDQSKDTVSNHNNMQQAALGYDQRLRFGDFECQSEMRGVTCSNLATNTGFFISRESYRVF